MGWRENVEILHIFVHVLCYVWFGGQAVAVNFGNNGLKFKYFFGLYCHSKLSFLYASDNSSYASY